MSNASTSVLSSFAIRGGKSDTHVTPRGKKSSSRRGEHEEDENDHAADLPPPSRAEHLILAWISINPSVKRLCGYGLEPFQEEIRFLLEGLLWREIQKWTNEEEEEEESSLASSSNAKEGGRVWVKGILVRAMMVFFILYPNYVVLATCAVFVRASLRARRRASLERRRNTKQKQKNKKKNKEEEDVVVPRMSAYGVIVLETIADRLETIASIASGRDPLALRVACFACAWLFVLSFFVSFSAWFAAVALFATKPKGAKRVLEACFR